MYKLISYPLRKDGPAWPGNSKVDIIPQASIEKGDICNTYLIQIFNHYGTHFDAPNHFYSEGLSIASLPITQFIYQKPVIVDIPKKSCEKIEPEDLIPFHDIIKECDILMIKTGFYKIRKENPKLYEEKGPAISSSTAKYLTNTYYKMKAIALDFVSLASYTDQTDGNLAHQYMLGKYSDNYICIIEDVNLENVPSEGLKSAAAIPLIIEGIDSCPCTMWVEY